jgi:hypothetical protein
MPGLSEQQAPSSSCHLMPAVDRKTRLLPGYPLLYIH